MNGHSNMERFSSEMPSLESLDQVRAQLAQAGLSEQQVAAVPVELLYYIAGLDNQLQAATQAHQELRGVCQKLEMDSRRLRAQRNALRASLARVRTGDDPLAGYASEALLPTMQHPSQPR